MTAKQAKLKGRVVEQVLCTLGDDPPPSLLFGAPAISVQQLERTLSLEANSLDPTDLIATLAPVAETSFLRRHDVEYKQVKRGKDFEDWLVFRPDSKAPLRPKNKLAPVVEGRSDLREAKTNHKLSMGGPEPKVMGHGELRRDAVPSRGVRTGRGTDGRPVHPVVADPDPEAITVPLLPLSKPRPPPPPLELNKGKSLFSTSLFSRNKSEVQEDRSGAKAAPPAEPVVITLPPPHKLADMLHVEMPLVAAAPRTATTSERRDRVRPEQHLSRETGGERKPREAMARELRTAVTDGDKQDPTSEMDRDQPKTAEISVFPALAEAKRALLASSGAGSKLEKEAALRRRAAERLTVQDTPQSSTKTRISTEAEKLPSGSEKLSVEIEPLDAPNPDEEALESPMMARDSSTPLSPSSYDSQYSSDSLFSGPFTPSTASSFAEEQEEPPPATPWLEVVFNDLPFGPGAPALQISEWLQDRWQLLAAQVVAILACAYVVHAAGM